MTEKVKESISALVDEEISEIEVHRLLRQYSDDDELRTTFVSYQQIRAIIKQENHLSHAQHVDLHSNILAAIEMEETPELSSEMTNSPRAIQKSDGKRTLIMFPERMKLPAAGMAVAASMVVAVFVGFNVLDNPTSITSVGDQSVLATTTSSAANTIAGTNNVSNSAANPSRQINAVAGLDANTTGAIATQPVSNQVAMQATQSSALQSELIEVNDSLGELRALDPDKQRQLRQYLNQHDRNIRMNPYARTVDYKQPKQK